MVLQDAVVARQYLSSLEEFQRTARFWTDTYAVKVGREGRVGCGCGLWGAGGWGCVGWSRPGHRGASLEGAGALVGALPCAAAMRPADVASCLGKWESRPSGQLDVTGASALAMSGAHAPCTTPALAVCRGRWCQQMTRCSG